MKKLLLAIALSALSVPAFAAKDCEELLKEIDAKIRANGVATFTLEVVDANAAADGKTVVGTCEAGKKKIVYKKG